MPDYRIVYNEHTRQYRVERRGLWGWAFVMDQRGEDYLTFTDHESARRCICARLRPRRDQGRRWRVVDPCGCLRVAD